MLHVIFKKCTPLHKAAAMKGNVEVTSILIQNGANVNSANVNSAEQHTWSLYYHTEL